MPMMSADMLPQGGGGAPMGAGADDNDGDVDTMVTCPQCGAQFAPGDTDNDAAQLAAGAGAAPAGPASLATAAPPPVVGEGGEAGEEAAEGSCPECGSKMAGGTCPTCGYSKGNSPMRKAAEKYAATRPEHERPDVNKVVEQGRRVRERMRRPAPFGRP